MSRLLPSLIITLLLSPTIGCASYTSSGYETPESMRADPETGAYYVSNVNGDPFAKDGNGYISRITPNGAVVIQKFIGGKPSASRLDAPKGIWIEGPLLYVTDIDRVRVFEKGSGKEVRTISLEDAGARFANDIVMDAAGRLYVSDTIANKIFRIDTTDSDAVSIFREGDDLGGPNGLVINPRNNKLTVVTWETGEILEIDPDGKMHRLKRGLKKLDGVDYDVEGTLYVSSFENGEIYRIPFFGRGTLTVFQAGLVTPADISCDRKKHELLVASFMGNTLETYPLFLKKDPILKGAARPQKDPPDQGKDGK